MRRVPARAGRRWRAPRSDRAAADRSAGDGRRRTRACRSRGGGAPRRARPGRPPRSASAGEHEFAEPARRALGIAACAAACGVQALSTADAPSEAWLPLLGRARPRWHDGAWASTPGTLVLRDVHLPPRALVVAAGAGLVAAGRRAGAGRRRGLRMAGAGAADSAHAWCACSTARCTRGHAGVQVAAMSELLRRAARRVDPAADRLQGEAWLRSSTPDDARKPRSAQGPGALLLEAAATAATVRRGRGRRAALPLARARFLAWMAAGMMAPLRQAVAQLARRLRLAVDAAGGAAAMAGAAPAAAGAWHRAGVERAVRRIAAGGGRARGRRAAPRRRCRRARRWLAWILLCVAAARPQQLGEAVQPPQAGRDLMLAVDLSGSMSEPDMELGGRAGRPPDRGQGGAGRFPRPPRRRPRRPARVRPARLRADAADPGPRHRARAAATTAWSGWPGGRPRSAMPSAWRSSACATQPRRAARADPADRRRQHRRRARAGQGRANWRATDGVRMHTIAFGGEGAMSVFGFQLPMPGGGDEIDEATLREIAAGHRRALLPRARYRAAGRHLCRDRPARTGASAPGEAVRPRIERYPWPLAGAWPRGAGVLWPAVLRARGLRAQRDARA